jgi:hypothetical protein
LPPLIARCLFEYVFTGKPKGVQGDIALKLVRSGFGRYTTDSVTVINEPMGWGYGGYRSYTVTNAVVIDEPIALLAAAKSLPQPYRSLQHILLTHIASLRPGESNLASERFGAYLLGMAFQSPIKLSSVFTYTGRNATLHAAARLVAIHKDKKTFQCRPVDFSKPNYILGHSTSDEQQTLAWLRDPKGAVFCFPTKSVGPDLIFALQCSDGTILRVLVQFRCTSENTGNSYFTPRSTQPKTPIAPQYAFWFYQIHFLQL